MEQRVIEIIREVLDYEGEITLKSNLRDDLGADSLDAIELIMEVEQEFDIQINDEDIPKVKTVADIVNYIKNAK